MTNQPFRSLYANLIQQMGEPTLKSVAELRKIQQNCVGRENPNAFYVTIDPRPEPKVIWSYNAEAHFELKAITYDNFFAIIHPFWVPIYTGLAEFCYDLIGTFKSEEFIRGLGLSANIPLRHKSGNYYWYNQISFAGSFDAEGRMIAYLSELHLMAEFNRMVPAKPTLTHRGDRVEAFDLNLDSVLNGLLENSLRQLLTPANYRLLHAYRLMDCTGCCNGREEIADYIGASVQAIDKTTSRLLSQARLVFPAVVVGSAGNLAAFLNEMFGKPLVGNEFV